MYGLTSANVKEGGAVIDTDGYDITIAQALLHASGAMTSPLVKNGVGNLTLAGTNTLLGPVAINGGTLTLAGAAQLGAGNLTSTITNDGALVFAGSADQTLAGAVSGSGSLTKGGAGTLTLTGVTSYSGDTTVGAGKLAVVSGGSLSNSAVTLASGTTLGLRVFANTSPWNCKSLAVGGARLPLISVSKACRSMQRPRRYRSTAISSTTAR
jgi:autotransporter-associated beta strand protein